MRQTDTHAYAIACLILAILIGVMFWIAAPAHSQAAPQPGCAPSIAIDEQLEKRFGETITAAGVLDNGFLYVTTNPTTHTFTVLIRQRDGTSCIIFGGKGFALADPAPKKGVGL